MDLTSILPQLQKLPEVLGRATPAQKAELLEHMEALLRDESGWPRVYYNRDTLKVYKPHHQEERKAIYNDVPRYMLLKGGEGGGKSVAGIIKTLNRIKRGMSGMMICVAADTLVDGVPIAERTESALVNTLLGPAWGSPSIREGQGDLFRVVTESGDWVVVTASHQFLTPTGWRPLRDLHVGALIASDDSEHGQTWREISPGSLGDCWSDLHPYGESTNPWVRYAQGRQRRLVERETGFSCLYDYQAHAYIEDSFCLSGPAWGVQAYQPSCEVDVSVPSRCYASCRVPRQAFGSDSHLACLHDPISHFVGNGARMQSDHSRGLSCSPMPPSFLLDSQYPLSLALGQTRLESAHNRFSVDYSWVPLIVDRLCQHYNTQYVKIANISFQEYGDFYGLTVPSVGHYSAHGLFHHNSPTLTHFQVSLWPEFQRWCPWDMVIDGHQRMSKPEWVPLRPFSIVFKNGKSLQCTGIKDPGNLEGPNLSFVHFDEARHFPTALALKTLDGRVRIPGPNGELPQIFITTTPRMNWLYDYFGPIKEPIDEEQYESFKRNSLVVTLLTKDNEINLEEDFRAKRAQTLTPAEIAVLLDAEWGDIEAGQPFLPNMLWWDSCKEELPALTWREPVVVALDAATGRQLTASDCFALIVTSRHPDPTRADTDIAVRFTKTWRARPGQKIDFVGDEDNPGPELVLRDLCERFHVICVVYDPTELHSMALRMQREGVAWFEPFTQSSKRWESDRQLLNLIQHKRIAHDGDVELRTHIARADRKLDASGKRLRIVKRVESQPIDLAVALSMAAWQVLYLNV